MQVEISISGLESVLNGLQGLSERAADISPVAPTIGLIMQADVDERFASAPGVRETGQVYGGATWESLTDAYLKSNKRREGGQQLRDTGELLNSFGVGQPGNVFESSKDSVSFGSNLPKAEFLNRKRRLIIVHQELIDAVSKALEIWVVEGKK